MVQVPQVAMLRTCPKMTLYVEWDENPNFDFERDSIGYSLLASYKHSHMYIV